MQNHSRRTVVALVVLFAGFLAAKCRAQEEIPWLQDARQALQIAGQRQKLVLLHFWSESCGPCLQLERQVFNQPEVIRAINASFVPVRLNTSHEQQLAAQLRIDRIPMDIVLAPNGRELFRGVSHQDPNRYVSTLDQIAAGFRAGAVQRPSQMHAPDPASADDPRLPDDLREQPSIPVGQNPIDGLGAGTPPRSPARGVGAAGAAASPSSGPAEISNPYVNRQPAPEADSRARVSVGAPPSRPAGTPAFDPAAAPRSQVVLNSHGSSEPARSAPSAAGVGPQAGPQAPPSLALKGHCPVTLVQQDTWQRGDTRWGAIHRGRTYLFVTQAAQQAFLANPDRYTPMLSGYDVVRFTERRELAEGNPNFGLNVDGQMFFFADEAGRDRFESAPQHYIEQVRVALRQRQSAADTARRPTLQTQPALPR